MTVILINKSRLSGKESSMEFNMDPKEFNECYLRWRKGELIQKAFPMLNAAEREFIISGVTPEEWNAVFGPDE